MSFGSPQVSSKSADTSKKRNEIEPLPLARQGDVPESSKARRMLKTPMPKTLSDTDAEIATMK